MANVARLREQLAKLQKELKQAERKEKTRKYILHGIALLKGLESGGVKQEYITQLLDAYITKASDREFLGLNNPQLETSVSKTEAIKTTGDLNSSEHSSDNGNQPNHHEYHNHY